MRPEDCRVISNAIILSLQGFYDYFRKACEQAGGQSAWARKHALTPQFVSDVLNGRREPNEAMLKALGLAKVPMFKVVGEA
jgi:hypothetical protein